MKKIDEPVQQSRKRYRYSKNKKKGWRSIDVSDIIEASNDKSREERLGGPVEDRQFEDLFILDVGEAKEAKAVRKGPAVSVGGLKPLRRSHRPLKSQKFLNGLPGAKAISKKCGENKQKENRVIKHARKLSKGTPAAELKRKFVSSQRKSALKKKKKITNNDKFNVDLWGKKKEEIDKFDPVSKTFMIEPYAHYKTETKKIKIKTPGVRLQKSSALPMVIPPDPGASYNPSFEDHQKLLAEAVRVENERLKQLAKIERMVKKYTPAPSDVITREEKFAEMAEGLPLSEEQEDQLEEEVVDDDQESTFAGPAKKEKKSKQVRTKTKTLKVKDRQMQEKKRMREREKDVFKVKIYEKELSVRDRKLKQREKRREKKKLRDMSKVKRLSKYKFEEGDVIVPLGNELSSTLRGVNPMGNPIEDIFNNWRRRNIIDTRKKITKPKPKSKTVFKRKATEGLHEFVHSLLE